MERFLKKTLPGWIFIDFEVILEGVLGAMLLIISVSTRCSVGVMGTARERHANGQNPAQTQVKAEVKAYLND